MSPARLPPLWVSLGSLSLGLAGVPAWAGPPVVQITGTAGCVSDDGTAGACTDGFALDGPTTVAESPDGRSVYVVGSGLSRSELAIFDRSPDVGILHQKAGTTGCFSETGSGGTCADGVGLEPDLVDVVVSPDGGNVYTLSLQSDAVAVFDRNLSTGALAQKAGVAGCVSETGTAGACADAIAMDAPTAIGISPDGRSVYVTSILGDALAVFDRDPAGVLAQKAGIAGCWSRTGTGGLCAAAPAMFDPVGVAVSPDGRNVYVALSGTHGGVGIFDRDPATGALTLKPGTAGCITGTGTAGLCTVGQALAFAESVVSSLDGRNVYVASLAADGVAVFDRDAATGALVQKPGLLGCISEPGGGVCTDGAALDGPRRLALGPEGRSLYVASSGAIAVLDREPSTGVLSQPAGLSGCIGAEGAMEGCAEAVGMLSPSGVTVSPDGRSLYVAAFESNAVAVFTRAVSAYDVDGDDAVSIESDGLMLMRFLFGFPAEMLPIGAVDLDRCTRCTGPEIEAFIRRLLTP